MADFDPPEEEFFPFDPFFDTAIRLKCPGLNQRITFIDQPDLVKCAREFAYVDWMTHSKASNTNCRKVFPNVTDAIVKPLCRKIIGVSAAFTVDNATHITSLSCKILPIITGTFTNQRGMRCAIITKGEPLATESNACHLGKKDAPTSQMIGMRPCRSIFFRDEDHPPQFASFRRQCGIVTIEPMLTKWACKSYVVTSTNMAVVILRTNLEICRTSEIFDSTVLPTKKPCIAPGLADPVFHNPGIAPRSGNCIVYMPLAMDFFGGRFSCNSLKSLKAEDLNFTVVRTAFSCKVNNQVGYFTVKKFRCPTYLKFNATLRYFGRIWGGRPSTDFIVRSSGRMMGKFR